MYYQSFETCHDMHAGAYYLNSQRNADQQRNQGGQGVFCRLTISWKNYSKYLNLDQKRLFFYKKFLTLVINTLFLIKNI